jgi:16S rRNA processing protein RimM
VTEARWIPLAEVARAHGVRGELRLRVFNQDSDILLGLDEVLLRFPNGDEHEVSVDAARRANDAILMKLHSVDDRDRADEVRGALVCARREEFPPLGEGEFYACDVIGLDVLFGEDTVGHVKDFRSYPSVDILVIRTEKGELEVPLVEAFVETVDIPERRVRLRTLEGF